MSKSALNEIRERLQALETELEAEIDQVVERKREQFRYTVRAGKVHFEAGIHSLHQSYRTGVIAQIRNAPISYVITAPITYALLVPLLLLDLSLTIFQQVCFRVYGIKLVVRRDHLVFDRRMLGYLNALEKLNCIYCSYGNGLIEYAREIAARTEQYWCPIKHTRRTRDAHRRMEHFFDYGDADAFRTDLPRIRAKLLD